MGGGGAARGGAGGNRLREHFRENWPKPRPGHESEQNHWLPKQHHALIKKAFREKLKKEFETKDPIERGFHKYIHGKGRRLKEAYNEQVRRWAEDTLKEGRSKNFDDFAKLVAKKRDEVYLKLYEIYQQFAD